ncbi:MAG TPA: DUF1801 domain-containing protein [Nocardioides sp.]|uniref:iron chaperone n=1 Tax=Nocardioides sp. TaxID=35761 RepID=UPI002CD94C05|nr:DUF1801 domain-containing protein [Nocardioides sp.]HTW13917.1 DUF1801 domain-containing protein [Nocardioides sp.]
MAAKATTGDEYVDQFEDPAARERLAALRELVTSTAPELLEQIKWSSLAYVHPDGVIMLMVSGHKAHANVAFTPSTREHFDGELGDFHTGKGSVKLPYDAAVPTATLARMIEHRVREYERDGVKWM